MLSPRPKPAEPGGVAAGESAGAVFSGVGEVELARSPQPPGLLFWRQFRRSPFAVAAGALLVLFHGLALLAPFVAPYGEDEVDRERFYHPPQRLHVLDASGRLIGFHVRATRLADPSAFEYVEQPARAVPLRWF